MPFVLALAWPSAEAVAHPRHKARAHTDAFTTQDMDRYMASLEPTLPFGTSAFNYENASCIAAVVLLRDAVRLPHPVDLNTIEHRLLRDMHMQQGIAGVFLLWTSVLEVVTLCKPLPHHARGGGSMRGPNRQVFPLHSTLFRTLCDESVVLESGACKPFHHVLQAWQATFRDLRPKTVDADVLCMAMFPRMLHLVCNRRWRAITLREERTFGGKHVYDYLGVRDGVRMRSRLQQNSGQSPDASHARSSDDIFDLDRIRVAASLMRDPTIFSATAAVSFAAGGDRGDSDAEDIGYSRQDIIQWLDRLGDLAQQGPAALIQKCGSASLTRGHESYRVEALIESILLADLLRNTGELREILARSASFLLGSTQLTSRILDDSFSLPGKTLVSRYRLSLDAAYCKVVRDFWSKLLLEADAGNDFSVYFLCDSSPRAGRDWLLAESYVIADSDVARLIEIQNEIVQLRQGQPSDTAGHADHEGANDLEARISRLSQEMHGKVWHHIHVPLAMGKGATQLHQKFTLLLHGFRLEANSWNDVRRIAERMVTITTDYGTESGIQQVPLLDGSVLHPHWRDVSELIDDSADLEAETAFPSCPPSSYVSFERALPIPGVMHMLHNALDDMTESLPDFAYWMERATATARYLSDRATKDALILHCFNSGPSAWHKRAIEHFSSYVYEKRFGSLMTLISNILPLQGVLSTYFNAAALEQGQLQKGSVSAVQVSEAVRSPWWWGYCHVLQSAGGLMFELECYLHGCACHPTKAFDLHGTDSYYRRRKAYSKDRGYSIM